MERFKELEAQGLVRLRIEADPDADMDFLKGDTFNREVNPEIPEERMAREERDFEERVEREGVWGVVGEYFDGCKWQRVDSCWGFVGDDWKESGYDADIMAATVAAYDSLKRCPTCNHVVNEEVT